jgi:hypothetical protein
MELTQARLLLVRAMQAASTAAQPAAQFRAARQLLVRLGAEALGIDPASITGIAELIGCAARAPASPARRNFAVLIVDALAVHGLLSARSGQLRLDHDICAFLECALPDVLLRYRYPFGADLDVRRYALAKLHASIDEHLRAPEPTFPRWLSGLPDP